MRITDEMILGLAKEIVLADIAAGNRWLDGKSHGENALKYAEHYWEAVQFWFDFKLKRE